MAESRVTQVTTTTVSAGHPVKGRFTQSSVTSVSAGHPVKARFTQTSVTVVCKQPGRASFFAQIVE